MTATPGRDERGAIAIMMALSLTIVLVASAFVLDFGLVRVDRQITKSGADAATLAGLQGLNSDDGTPHPFAGVCTAIRYLNQNDRRFATLSDTSGSWTDGNGNAVASGACSSTPRLRQACVGSDKSTWAKFTWTTTFQGTPLAVTIQSGYTLPDPAFAEDALSAAASDQNDSNQGCSQLAVIVRQNRKPGFGSLATSSQLVSTIRSVGRVRLVPGGYVPALLLLRRTGCPILQTGSTSGGSHVYVFGAASSNGSSQPGTVHADSNGTNCSGGSNQNIFNGRSSNGIVAFAAPLVANPLLPDPARPGQITSVAAADGAPSGVIRDSLANVYGSTQLDPATAPLGAKNEVGGRGMVTRAPVDDRYLTGVRSVVTGAQSQVFGLLTPANAASYGYVVGPGGSANQKCNPTQADINGLNLNSTSKLFIDCTANGGFKAPVTINAGTVVFAGSVAPTGDLNLPNATKVYVFGAAGSDGLGISNNTSFNMHYQGNTLGGRCSDTQASSSTNKAILVVKSGDIKQTGGTLRLCYTTVVQMGNRDDGCLPTTSGTAPTSTPCAGSSGDGQLSLSGGSSVDWTAPNQYDVMITADGSPDPARAPAWSDANGPEDLAFWSESYGSGSNPTYNMNGSGAQHVQGVYMAPNADPFSIGGGATQTLVNAQYIATSIYLNGTNTILNMSVDPNAGVPLPKLKLIGLVR